MPQPERAMEAALGSTAGLVVYRSLLEQPVKDAARQPAAVS